jgi:general secretion pathway protein D
VTAPLANTTQPALKSDDLGDKVIVAVDRPTNRLIAMGESRVLEQLEALIAELDVRQPQVLVEAMVVTLTDNQTRSLGVEMQRRGVHDDVHYQLSSLFGLGSPDPSFGVIPAATGTGFGGVVLDPGNFSAVVRALEAVNEGRSLNMPKVLVDNNQSASLDSVLQTPYASTNASTTVATTSFGGTLDAGTQIEITPQIASGGQLLLDYSVSLSSFTGVPSDPALPPPRQQNKLKSIATVPDGYTVVVGGLEVTTETKSRSSVPVLGDIPLVGALFSTQSKTENKARFFVFLRCNVMRASGFEDLKFASQQDLADAAVDDGQPKMKPRIMR